MTSADLEAFLDALPDDAQPIVRALRSVVRRTVPEGEESILWGGLSYHRPKMGGRVKGAVCQIGVKRGIVRLDFIHGIWLADPRGLLQGDRLSKRYVPIASVADAKRKAVVDLLRAAAAFDPTRVDSGVRCGAD